MPINELTLTFSKKKETKGTWQFKEDTAAFAGKRMPVDSVYLTKDALELLGNPENLVVIVRPR